MGHQLWKTLIRHNLSPNQIYLLDCYQSKIKPSKIINEDAERIIAMSKGLLTEEGNLTVLGTTILTEFETYLVKTKRQVASDVLGADLVDKIQEYRELFPKGKLPSGQLARQSVEELKQKFVWFFKTYPEYDWNLVLDATEYYNAVFKKKGYQFMVTSSYFIKKTNTISKEVTSKLADYCQEILDNPRILDAI